MNASGCQWSGRVFVQLLSRLVLTIQHYRFGTRDLKGVERRFGIVHVSREDTAFSYQFLSHSPPKKSSQLPLTFFN